jgi:dTDP-4-dehydrorhamnose reductase
MLARDLIPVLKGSYELRLTDVVEMDITDSDSISGMLTDFQPDIVINCAAYTQVDEAEGA